MQLYSTLSGWMSSSLSGQISRRNPLPFSARNPSPQYGLCTLVDFRRLLVSTFTTLVPERPLSFQQLRQFVCVVLMQGIHLVLHDTQTTYGSGCPSLLPRSFPAPPHRLEAHALHPRIYRGTFSLLKGIFFCGFLPPVLLSVSHPHPI